MGPRRSANGRPAGRLGRKGWPGSVCLGNLSGMAKPVSVKVYKWEPRKAEDKRPLPLLSESKVALPLKHDAAREEAQRYALRTFGGRVRGCSAIAPSGFAVVLDFTTGK